MNKNVTNIKTRISTVYIYRIQKQFCKFLPTLNGNNYLVVNMCHISVRDSIEHDLIKIMIQK